VNSEAGGAITILVGAVAVRLAITGEHRLYVKPAMGPWLLLAGGLLIVIGAVTWATAVRRGVRATEDDHGDHHRGVGVGWLLLAPVVTLLLIAPPALGAFGVDRSTRVDIARGELFEPLPPDPAPRAMTVLEFLQRAYDRDGASMADATVELTGFVADQYGGEGFRLARYGIACCAADALASVARVVADSPPPARDQWVRVTGRYLPGSAGDQPPVLVADIVLAVGEPDDPYE
jgi:uncharacterized repeat protein (TIGR03943 family)